MESDVENLSREDLSRILTDIITVLFKYLHLVVHPYSILIAWLRSVFYHIIVKA